MRLAHGADAMAALREMFPEGKADDLNFVLFSTSGVHGSYCSIEAAEAEPDLGVTFLIVQPRIVGLRYGKGEQRLPEWMVERYGYAKARRIGVVAMVGGKDKTRIRNATPLPFRDVLLGIARTVKPMQAAA